MKKLFKAALTVAVLCLTAMVTAVCVSAETEDVELSTATAKTTNGQWGQSVTYPKAAFDCSRITEDSVVEVEFELDGEWTGSIAPVELIFQNFTTADPQVWAKIEPFETDNETYAKFRYDEMVAAYGKDDFSDVDNMWLGDCGIKMKVTKFTITNCEKIEVTTTTTVTTTEATTTTTTVATTAPVTQATTTAATTAAESSGGGIPIIPIIVVTVVVAVIVVVVIIIIRSRRRFY